jgi:hypothetical protein
VSRARRRPARRRAAAAHAHSPRACGPFSARS